MRVVGRATAWSVDISPLHGGSIEEDLAQRDFTVNAMAEPLAGGDLVDPFGGRADLDAGRLRMVSSEAFASDPLRVLRLARLTVELGFEPEQETAAVARAHAPSLAGVAGERVFAELRRVVSSHAVLRGLALMDELEVTPVVLPELAGLRGVEQSAYHHLDVHDHTLAVLAELIELERDPALAFAEHAEQVAALLAEPLADGLTRGEALRFAALLHDAAKPSTRAVTPDGRITFIGHDLEGAALARRALGRLRASERLRAYVAALARHHLVVGFLVHERPLPRRTVYRYLRDCEPVAADVAIFSVADRMATRGRKADKAIARHLELARELLGAALAELAGGCPAALVRGDDLAAALDLTPGPEIGRLLAELEEARFAGEIATREEAIAHARALLERR